LTLQLENLSKFPSQINITISKNLNPCPIGLKKPSRLSDNNGGGEPPMDNKYVTHQELELSNEKLLHHMDNKFAEMQQQMNQRFNEVDKHFNNLELKVNDVKNTANNNKEKINWLLYTAIGGIIISVITTIISNLLTK
jgi:hypothetical protein